MRSMRWSPIALALLALVGQVHCKRSTSSSAPSSSAPSAVASAPAPPASSSSAARIAVPPDEGPALVSDAAQWDAWRDADYLVATPHVLADAIAPLARHREANGHTVAVLEVDAILASAKDGHPERALEAAIHRMWTHTAGKLAFVLIAGDVVSPVESSPPKGAAIVPTFYLPKLDYEHHTPKEHDNPNAVTQEEHEKFPSDDPYAIVATEGDASVRLALGRVPARTASAASAFVSKVIAYESQGNGGDASWRRRVTLFAGAANFGEVADRAAESLARSMLDKSLTYDDDVRFTFAKYGSPYAYRLDRMEQKLVADMNDGAIVAAYIGHGAVMRFAPADFRDRSYEVGTANDAAAMKIANGKPVFFSIACDTGAFDRPAGIASIAEEMILNPDGPIAVFASSRESHPYPNALYGQGIISGFINDHPSSIGEGIVALKDAMKHGSLGVAAMLFGDDVPSLKHEHEGLYNLFGDPAELTIAAPR
jgi:hypothetical protein